MRTLFQCPLCKSEIKQSVFCSKHGICCSSCDWGVDK